MEIGQPSARPETISIYDESVPGSVINSVPKAVAQKIRALHQGALVRNLTELDEPRLRKALQVRGYRPTPAENCLRANFWFEYNHAKAEGPPYVVDISRVCGTICSREFFYKSFLENPLALSWMLCPPLDYHQALSEAMTFGISEMRSLLDLPGDNIGRVNIKIGALRILGELSGQIRATKHTKKTSTKAEQAIATARSLTEADLEARRILIEKKMIDQKAAEERKK